MAQSRLEKVGTIFSRVEGLIRANAMKIEDRPIWYDLYVAFPPKLEPRYDRKAQDIPIRNIFYAEDVARAKYHKQARQYETINLADTKHSTQSQNFLEIYNNLKMQNPLDDEKLYETAVDMLAERNKTNLPQKGTEDEPEFKTSLFADYVDSMKDKDANDPAKKVNIQKLFSE